MSLKTFDDIRTIVGAARGEKRCDWVIRNVQLVNVYSREIQNTDLYMSGDWIVSTDSDAELEANNELDAEGRYALPGFIDSHVHFETTLLTPERIAEVVVPQGTTTLCADPMEIANVAGIEGIQAMMESIDELPFRTFIEISSRVPTAPGLETAGAELGLPEIKKALEWPETISLGELDPSKVLKSEDPQYLQKIAETLSHRKIVNGHAIGRKGPELTAYASAGISDDHECVRYEELLERIRRGMAVMVREGSSERNTAELIEGVVQHNLETNPLMFCSDDKHPQDIVEDGHINENINIAIEQGLDPLDAIAMATLNPARHFRIDDMVGSLTPGRKADIVLTEELNTIQPDHVFFEGRLVARSNRLEVSTAQVHYPKWIQQTVELFPELDTGSLQVPTTTNDTTTTVNCIELIDEQIINHWIKPDLPIVEGMITPDLEQDILKIVVAERHGHNGNIGLGFVKGFGLNDGAIASSVAHDHHNIVAVGTNDEDIIESIQELERLQGGFAAVVEGSVRQKLPLPIGGLMTDQPADQVIQAMKSLNNTVKTMGSKLPAPFMTLSFVSLPTVPDLGITDKGLVDVMEYQLIPLEAVHCF